MASAEVRFQFEGKFVNDSYPYNPLSVPLENAAIGIPYKFSITFNPAAPDLKPGDPSVGIYDAVTANELEIGGGALSDFVLWIGVLKNVTVFGELCDQFVVHGYRNPGGAYAGPGSFFFALELTYEAGSFLTDDLPLTLPDPSTAKGQGSMTGMLIREHEGLYGSGLGMALYVADVTKLTVDSDADGVVDTTDNCKWVENPDQKDTDGNGIGDACEGPDLDGDGVPDSSDNCKYVPNPFQEGTDNDGAGDVCDVCPQDPNNDIDGDGVCPAVDNCLSIYNPDQLDTDADGLGDACDPDDDNDGLLDVNELALGSDPRNPDTDGDGVPDPYDKCPAVIVDQVFEVPPTEIFAAIVSGRVTEVQSFVVGKSGILHQIQVPIGRNPNFDVGSSVHDLAFSVLRMSGGIPNDSQVLASVTVPASLVPPSPGFLLPNIPVNVGPFSIPVTAGDVLALVVSSPGTVDTPVGPYFWNGYDTTYGGGPGYTKGQRFHRIWNDAWTPDPTDDLGFRVFVRDATLSGAPVNDDGCAIAQICPCTGMWNMKGAYTSCVAKTANDFLASGLISLQQKGEIVSAAAKSDCGSKK